MTSKDDRLARHLGTWLGTWPPAQRLQVVGSERRIKPGWDGALHELVGVATPDGAVLSVPPDRVARVRSMAPDPTDPSWPAQVAAAMGRPDMLVGRGVFRVAGDLPTSEEQPDLGEWVAVEDPVVPTWLHPFGGRVLIARDAEGSYAAGVGVKRHDPHGRELSVGTEPAQRGQGLARRLVVTAARRLHAEGYAVTYLHEPENHASAAVAEAAGFSDRGWSVIGMWPA
jgi:GNAT superfamily N-acetyltransferase